MKLTPVYRHSPNGRSTRPFPEAISLMQRPRWVTVDPRNPCSAGLRLKIPSALDVGLGSITPWRRFVVPTTILVFVRNARRVSRNELLLRCRDPPLCEPGHEKGRLRRIPHRPDRPNQMSTEIRDLIRRMARPTCSGAPLIDEKRKAGS